MVGCFVPALRFWFHATFMSKPHMFLRQMIGMHVHSAQTGVLLNLFISALPRRYMGKEIQ